jgi:hypothetical protein
MPYERSADPVKIIELQRQSIFFVIDAAESSMPRRQFRVFKKLIFDHFHKVILPALYQELGSRYTSDGAEPSDSKVRAVPNDDRKGVLL